MRLERVNLRILLEHSKLPWKATQMSIRAALLLSRAPALAFAGLGLAWGAFAAFVPELKAGLAASDATFGALLLGSSLGLLTAMWLAPWLDTRLGGLAMPAAATSLAVAFLAPGLATSATAFAAAMVAVGVCSGLTDVVMNARVSEIESRHNRSLMSLNHAVFSFSYAAAAMATGLAREAALPPISIFSGIAVLIIVAAPFMVTQTENNRPDEDEAHFPMALVLWGGGIVLVAFLVENAMEGWSAIHIERTLGGGAAEGAFGPAILGLTMGAGRLMGQILAERVREAPVLIGAAGVAGVGMVLAAVAPVPAVAYLGFGLSGLGVSVIAPIALALVGRHAPAAERTKAISRTAVIGFLGFFIGPPLIGLVSEATSLRIAFVLVSVLLILVPAMLAAMLRSRKLALGS